MNTEKQNEVEDLKVTEAADGSATVDLPNDLDRKSTRLNSSHT